MNKTHPGFNAIGISSYPKNIPDLDSCQNPGCACFSDYYRPVMEFRLYDLIRLCSSSRPVLRRRVLLTWELPIR